MPSGRNANEAVLWPSGDQRAAEREAKREAVLRAAASSFSQNGYHATTLNDIAEKLGITKPTLYYYARNKAEMLEAVNARALADILAEESDPSATARDRLLALLTRYVKVVTTDFGRCLVRVLDNGLDEPSRKRLRAARREINQRITDLLEEGAREGSISAPDPKMATFLVAGAINWIGHWYDPEGPLRADEVAKSFLEQLADGFRPR